MQDNNRTARVERRANIVQSLSSEPPTCTPILQSAQGIFLDETGVSYNKQRVRKAGYFRELLATDTDTDGDLGSNAAFNELNAALFFLMAIAS